MRFGCRLFLFLFTSTAKQYLVSVILISSPTSMKEINRYLLIKLCATWKMSPFRKCGLIFLACFAYIVIFAYSYLNFKDSISIRIYLPNKFSNNANSNNTFHCDTPNETTLQTKAVILITASTITKTVANSTRNTSVESFKSTFQSFSWTEFEDVVAKNLTQQRLAYSKLFIEKLSYFLELEPLVLINESCIAPPLTPPEEIDCKQYPHAFNGTKRAQPSKIGVLIQFGFDVDILEIHFNELADVVDIFFLIESTHAHYENIKKPLMWEHVQQQERFKKFNVVHFIIDDAELANTTLKMFAMEHLQERLRWQKFLEWNNANKYFNDDDMLGFGDTDEIPSRSRLNLLKHCDISGDSIDFGIWFPFGHITQAFRSDYPIRGHPLTLGDPTYFKLKAAKLLTDKNPSSYPNRRRGHSKSYLLGGIHMTHYGYLPFQLVKQITATEGGLRTVKDVQKFSKYLKAGDIRSMETYLGATPKQHLSKIQQVNLMNPEMKQICILPWFYDCNRNRYPVWENGHDTRLD